MKTRLFLFNLVVCALFGPLIGLAAWLVFAGNPPAIFSRDFAGGLLFVYALITGAPFGIVAAVVATLICSKLLRSKGRPTRAAGWLVLGGAAGLVVGALGPVFLLLTGWGADGSTLTWSLAYAAIGGTAGAACGLLIGGYCWRLAARQPIEQALPGS